MTPTREFEKQLSPQSLSRLGHCEVAHSEANISASNISASNSDKIFVGPGDLLRRVVFAGVGILFVVIAAIGVFLPGIPTLGPLLVASFLLTKSCPALEHRLVRNRFFSPYLRIMNGTDCFPLKARLLSIAIMWTSILFSCLVLYRLEPVRTWAIPTVLIAGLVGTWFISRFGRFAKRVTS